MLSLCLQSPARYTRSDTARTPWGAGDRGLQNAESRDFDFYQWQRGGVK